MTSTVDRDRARPRVRPSAKKTALIAIACLILGAVTVGAVRLHNFASARDTPVAAPGPALLASVRDVRPVTVTVTTPAWTRVKQTVTMDDLRADFTLWRQMHFNDWDLVAPELRRPAVLAMIRAHDDVLAGSRVWRTMRASDWDRIPQPVRAIAYLRMIWHWAVAEDVGREFGLPPRVLAQTIGAIVMTESWFEHRAFNENPWGNRDLGLAQCSDYCREEIARMSEEGEISFAPAEADYFNPWMATRIATVWFERELIRSGGDVELAIRAYHRGQGAAMDEKGDVYLARVRRLRERYIHAQTASPTWRMLTSEFSRQ